MTTMPQSGDFDAVPKLGYEEWRAVVRSIVGRHNPQGIEPGAFAGRVEIRNLFGFCADQWDHNAGRIERTQRDVRLDDVESATARRGCSRRTSTTWRRRSRKFCGRTRTRILSTNWPGRASTPTRGCCEPLLVSQDCGQC